MEILAVLCHPQPGSFNHATADRVAAALSAAGHLVHHHDLYAEGFDPVLSRAELRRGYAFDPLVQAYCNELESSHGLLFVHPEWWGGPPALLKGWIERVFRPGLAYELEGEDLELRTPRGLLADRRALVLATSDSAEPEGADPAAAGATPLEMFWTRAVFDYCGTTERRVRVLRALRRRPGTERKEWIEESARIAVEWLAQPGP